MSVNFKKTRRIINKSKLIFMIIDAFGIALTYAIAILTLCIMVPNFDYVQPLLLLPFIIVFKLVIYYLFRLYNLVLTNVGLDEIVKIGLVVALTNVVIVIFTLSIPNFEFINEVCFVFTTLLELVFAIMPRIIRRLISIF
ncbi:MAG: hypothetical protein AB7U52_06165, partial [Candidatus Izemoplasmatales bacterium]